MEMKGTISGWGNYPVSSATLWRPERLRQLKVQGEKNIARGLGRSYGDASLNTDQNVLLMERLNRFLSFDEQRGILRAEAGASLEEILETFVPRGWFLPVTPGTKFVTLGGCLAADVHGKNHHADGTFGNHVKEIELILADGTVRRCSPTNYADLFWATVGGMGLTGIITEITLQLIPIESAYMMVTHQAAPDLDSVLEILSNKEKEEKYSVAWIDCLAQGPEFGRSIVMTGHHASLQELPKRQKKPLEFKPSQKKSIPSVFPSWVLNPWTVSKFNALFYSYQARKKKPFIADYDRYFYPLDSIHGWNRIYGKKGFLQYQFVMPAARAQEGLRVVLEELSASRRPSFLAVLKRFGPEGEGFLSFPHEGYTLALDLPLADPQIFPFLDLLDEIVLKYSGRIYLAKDARLKPESFQKMYPKRQKWQEIKSIVDPGNLFSSDLSRRLLLEAKR